MATNLFQAPPIAPFDVEGPNNMSICWDRFVETEGRETYITATELTNDKEKRFQNRIKTPNRSPFV